MEAKDIDFDNATEEQLASMRGDQFEATETSEAETTTEKDEPPVSAEPETAETAEAEAEDSGEGVSDDDSVAQAPDEAASEDGSDAPSQETNQTFMIPKSRYDAVMARLKESEAKNQQQPVEPAQQTAPEDPVSARLTAIDSELAAAVRDGDGDKTAQLMAETRKLQNQMFQQQLQETSTQTSAQAIEQVKYDTLVEQVEKFVPETNPDSDIYNEGMVLEVQDLMEAFQAKGHASSEALIRALNYVKPGWDAPEQAGTPAPEPTPEPAPEPEAKKTDVKKNIKDAKSTPPRMDAGENSDTGGLRGQLDVMKISDDEFAKLTEEQLADLRGDNG